MAKKWPEKVVKGHLLRDIHFETVFTSLATKIPNNFDYSQPKLDVVT